MLYFDYAASTPLDPRSRQAMNEALEMVGNPSSLHAAGRTQREVIDRSRASVARLLGVQPSEIIFTSGATEANNMAIRGLFRAAKKIGPPDVKPRILSSPFEHSSAQKALESLAEREGAILDYLPVDSSGTVQAESIADMIRRETALVCVMWANNVLGSLQSAAEIGKAVAAARSKRGTDELPMYFFCDAAQAMRTEPVLPAQIGADALSISAHKMYGPKGAGALYLRQGVSIEPLLVGGGQERGLRSGTENVAAIAGFGKAAEILLEHREADARHAVELQIILIRELRELEDIWILNNPDRSVPGIVFIGSRRFDGDTLALKLDVGGAAISAGSACDAGTKKPPAALLASLGEKHGRHGGVRISFGRFTTEEDVKNLVRALASQTLLKGDCFPRNDSRKAVLFR